MSINIVLSTENFHILIELFLKSSAADLLHVGNDIATFAIYVYQYQPRCTVKQWLGGFKEFTSIANKLSAYINHARCQLRVDLPCARVVSSEQNEGQNPLITGFEPGTVGTGGYYWTTVFHDYAIILFKPSWRFDSNTTDSL